MALVISSPLVANVLPIINLPMTLENLPIAANGLPMVPIGNDMWVALDNFLHEFTSEVSIHVLLLVQF